MTSNLHKWSAEEPRPFEWIIFLVALFVQQGAFISLPILIQNVPLAEMRDFDNPLNRFAVTLSLLSIGWIGISQIRALAGLARMNKLAVVYICLVVLSTSWSIHPDITIRRSLGYILTMLVAALLPVRFGIERFMKVLSLSFAISAIGSLVFVLIAPGYGIMQEGDLAGCWQGVFCTKESLGSVMAIAVFVEAYILIQCKGTRYWRYGLSALFFSLIILSLSMTALLTAIIIFNRCECIRSLATRPPSWHCRCNGDYLCAAIGVRCPSLRVIFGIECAREGLHSDRADRTLAPGAGAC